MLPRQKHPRQLILFLLFLVFVIALISVAIYTVTAGNTIGTDIFVFYLAGRSSFIEGQGPYIPDNYLQSQILTYGHPAAIGEDPLIFGYPPYSLFPILPLFFIPFEWTQAIWFALMLLCITLIPFLVFPDCPRWLPATIFLIYPFSFGLLMGNFAIPIGIIALAIYGYFFNSVKANRYVDLAAGVALAWCTCKPQFIWVFMIFYIIAAIKQRRIWFIYGFIGSLTVFLILSFAVSPTWLVDWWIQVKDYAQYIQSTPRLVQLFNLFLNKNQTIILASLASLIMIGWLVIIIIQYYQGKKDSFQVLCWIGLISHLLYPGGVAYEQITFIIPFLIWLLLYGRKYPKLSIPLWGIAIIVSWFELVQYRLFPNTHFYNEWLFIYYLIWMMILLYKKNRMNYQTLFKVKHSN